MKRLVLALLPLLICPQSAWASDVCDAVAKLIAIDGDFKSLKGEKLRDGAWSSKLKIADFSCEVRTVSGKLGWFCDAPLMEEARAKDANLLFEKYDKEIKVCPSKLKSEHMQLSESRRALYFTTGDTILSSALVKDIDMVKPGVSMGWRLRIYAAE